MAEETSTPRHGRHAAGRHAAPRTETPQAPAKDAAAGQGMGTLDAATAFAHEAEAAPAPAAAPLSELVPIIDGDQETSMGDAPRPIGVDPGETGSFQRISAAEGARLTTRANAIEVTAHRAQGTRPIEAVRMSSVGRPHVEHREVEVKSNKRVFLVLGIGAAVMMGIVLLLLGRAARSVEGSHEQPVFEQAQASADDGIEYRGTSYQVVEQSKGKYALVSTGEGQEAATVLYELAGTPVTLILYNTVFVIPENLSDGTWDLIAHPLGGGSVTQQVTDADGKPIIGQGQIAKASLSGDQILVTTESGEELTVSLV